jgi:hypothetical protein
MSSPSNAPRDDSSRRPLPALVFLVGLTVLAALVWWRVLSRDDGNAAASPTCPPSPSASRARHLPEQKAIVVQVLNSTHRQGIAGAAQRALVQDGFQAPASAANDSKHYPGYHGVVTGVADIRTGPAGAPGAKLLAYYFPGSRLVRTKEQDATVLVSLGKKYHGVASQRHVRSKLKAAGITLVPVTVVPDAAYTTSRCGASPTG